MSTVTNAVWELQLGVVTAAAELVSGLNLRKMSQVTEVAKVAPPTLHQTTGADIVNRAPLAEQLALVDAAINFQEAYAALLDSQQ